jgi:hypothetical protein
VKPTAPPAPSGDRTDDLDGERSSGPRGRNRDRLCSMLTWNINTVHLHTVKWVVRKARLSTGLPRIDFGHGNVEAVQRDRHHAIESDEADNLRRPLLAECPDRLAVGQLW